jgi:hypothetical protein
MYLDMYPCLAPPKIKHIVSVSSGAPSALLAFKVIEKYGAENVDCIFADTLAEHADNYRFLHDLRQRGIDILYITRGKTPNQLQREQNTVFTQKLAPCTRILKLEPIREFVQFRQAQGYSVHMHIGYTVEDRSRIADTYGGWYQNGVIAEFLFAQTPKYFIFEELKQRGLHVPETYQYGLPNANCLSGEDGGGCVKGGKGYMLKILIHLPRTYAAAERTETAIRIEQYKRQRAKGVRVADVRLYARLRDATRVAGHISLKAFREQHENAQRDSLQAKLFILNADGDVCASECGVIVPEKWSKVA